MQLRNLVGLIVGLLFIGSAFVPLGSYHFEGEADIVGVLWNFMLPTGWFGIIFGVILLFHKQLRIKNKRLTYVVLVASLLIITLIYLQDVDYFLGLWHGIKGDFDVNGKCFLTPVSFYVGLIGLFVSLLLMMHHQNND